ncbi:tape measure protein [Sphingomonas faeni]|uniref:tape measure protein n=1 Tax=Sphingomonas faeni TaxID=185950 RepID=UPI0033526654
MPQIDPVILQLRADVKQYQNEIRATTTLVSNQLDRQERSILSLEAQTERSTARIADRFSVMGQRVAGFVGGFALGAVIRELASLADQSKQLDSQLKLATATFGNFGQAQADVQRISELTRGSLEATSKLYAGFVRASQETGRSQADAARATQTFAEALKIGGAGAEEAASATLQFNQALQSGVLRGDEFNSIMEASPRIARLLAQSLGVPVGQLRAMAEQGKITSDVLFRALTDRKFTAGIDAEFKQVPVTFGDAMTAIENTALTTFGKFDQGGQFSNAIVAFLGTGTDTFRGLTNEAEQFGADTRAVFDGLGNVFDPMDANAAKVFDALGIRIYSVREQISSLLHSIDNFRNILPSLQNQANAFDRRVFGRQFGADAPLASSGAAFDAGTRRSAAQSRRDQAARRLEAQGYTVPRNPDGSVNEAGIVRRPAVARPRLTAPVSGGGGGARRAAGGRARSGGAIASDAADAADIVAALRKDLFEVEQRSGKIMQTDAERLSNAAKTFTDTFGDEGQSFLSDNSKRFDTERQAAIDVATEADDEAQRVREKNVYQLAGLYESLFQEGTGGIWRNFKDQGLRTLALIAAQATIASFGKGGGGFGSLLGNIASSASAIFSKTGVPGRASGGYVAPGQTVRVNEGRGSGVELLRMGGQGGTVIPLGQTRANQPSARGGNTYHIIVSADNSVTPAGFARGLAADILTEAKRMDSRSSKTTLRNVPGTIAQRNALKN